MFPTTNWIRLGEATMEGQEAGREALSALCRDYRPAIMAHLRSRGISEQDADDIAQQFFLAILHSRAWQRADKVKGRFRSFLLGILEHVLAHRREQANAQKRGSGQVVLSLDAISLDGLFVGQEGATTARDFDREWALRMIEIAFQATRTEWIGLGKETEFEALKAFLPGDETAPAYEDTASRLKASLSATKSAIHRLRRAFRMNLRKAVARTVPFHELEHELRYLREVLEN